MTPEAKWDQDTYGMKLQERNWDVGRRLGLTSADNGQTQSTMAAMFNNKPGVDHLLLQEPKTLDRYLLYAGRIPWAWSLVSEVYVGCDGGHEYGWLRQQPEPGITSCIR